MNQSRSSFKFRHNLFGLFGILLGGIALTLTVIHFYAGSIENKVKKEISYKEMAINYFTNKAPEKKKPSFDIKTDKNIKILAGFMACLGLIMSALSHLKNETKNANLAAVYISLGAIGFQLLTHSLMMLVGFILMVFLFSKFNLVK